MENTKKSVFSHSFRAIGTEIGLDISLDSENKKTHAMATTVAVEQFLKTEEEIFSRFDPESELSKINSKLGEWHKTSPSMLDLAKKIISYSSKSDGLYDPRIIDILEKIGYRKSFLENDFASLKIDTDKINFTFKNPLKEDLKIKNGKILFSHPMDFSGLAKGYLADKVSLFIKNQGFENFIVDLGGDMFISGKKKGNRPWHISIEDIPEEKVLLKLQNLAIATSGISRKQWGVGEKRFHHLINPLSPEKFSLNVLSVSVIAKTVIEADFLAKIIFLMGKTRGKKYCIKENIPAFFLNSDKSTWLSPRGKKFLA